MSSLLYLAHVGLFVAAALASFASVPRARQIEHEDTRIGMTGLLVSTGLWAAATAGYFLVPNPRIAEWIYVFGLVGAFTAVGAWVYFAAAYTARPPRRAPFRWVAVAVYLAVVGSKLTNPIHNLYFTAAPASTPFQHLAVQYGPLYWVVLGLSYVLAAIGFFMLLEMFHHAGTNTRPLAILVALTALPVSMDLIAIVHPSLLAVTYEPIGVAAFAIGVLFFYFERFQAVQLAGDIDDPVLFVDLDGCVRDYNQAARDLFPAVASGVGDPLETAAPALAAALDDGTDTVTLDRNSQTEYYHVSTMPFGTDETVTSRLVVLNDVTDTRRHQAELERISEQLAVLNRVVRHDIRNDMNVILGWSEQVRDHVDADGRDALERIRETARHVVQITTVARDFVEALTNADEPDLRPVDLQQSLTVEIESLRESYPEVEVDVTLPDRSVSVQANEMLSSVFQNVLHNAVQHNDHDEPTITVSASVDGETATVRIADDGPGIPDGRKTEVFGKGEMGLDSSGTGIGLYLVVQLVEQYGGEVWIADNEPRGAVFVIRLPLADD
ncbi:Signal transduction histidine kinase, contains PAS domain [Halanaeroarchaeum sp. HSR-CO]|uniref:sensor histidine kinase n=1 Tax=Halanaeroarchaeum sp. HSR-CO TaxID=2866382 RepID=UPI00217D8BB6|nr:ATP-binding protein [Halanaeroarchaeum sp. HSR-CO]UWG46685.1 Signal transduction histidine kinase, contains PAS domain [Halanaeroarchaeum sp. HSR-CO]